MKYSIIGTIILILLFGCSEKGGQSASDYSNSLIVLSNASNVKYQKIRGSDQITYKVIDYYPAKDSIDELNRRLENKKWTPLETGWLNPDIPTSHIRGWGNFTDGTERTEGSSLHS